jgi:hypothetical protein
VKCGMVAPISTLPRVETGRPRKMLAEVSELAAVSSALNRPRSVRGEGSLMNIMSQQKQAQKVVEHKGSITSRITGTILPTSTITCVGYTFRQNIARRSHSCVTPTYSAACVGYTLTSANIL